MMKTRGKRLFIDFKNSGKGVSETNDQIALNFNNRTSNVTIRAISSDERNQNKYKYKVSVGRTVRIENENITESDNNYNNEKKLSSSRNKANSTNNKVDQYFSIEEITRQACRYQSHD